MNTASVGDEFHMSLKRVTSKSSFEIYEKSSYNIDARRRNKKQGEKKESKEITFS